MARRSFRCPRRRPRRRDVAIFVVGVVVSVGGLTGCGDDDSIAAQRRDQVRQAVVDAGLDDDVAEFLATTAAGDLATYRVVYPAPADGATIVVTNRPPDRRVDLVADGEIQDTRLVLDGEAHSCIPQIDGGTVCTRTDAFVDPPGTFRPDVVTELAAALGRRVEDYDFELRDEPIAGTTASCLITTIKPGRQRPELGVDGTICISADGVLLRVSRAGERLEALEYSTDVDGSVFRLPDRD